MTTDFQINTNQILRASTSTSVIYQIGGEINLDNQAAIQISVQATVLAKFSRSPQPYKSMYEDIESSPGSRIGN